jgi:hypothetical protein
LLLQLVGFGGHVLANDAQDTYFSASPNSPIKWEQRTTREAAQRGIEWLERASLDWGKRNNCFGCHVQAQILMGLSIAKKNKYLVNDSCVAALAQFTEGQQTRDGSYYPPNPVTATLFAAMGLAFFDQTNGSAPNPAFIKSAKWLLDRQGPTGEVPIDHSEAPIDQGSIMATANSIIAFTEAFRETGDRAYQKAAELGLGWIASAVPETTQDKVFSMLALTSFGNRAQRQLLDLLVKQLLSEQRGDGGWAERKDMDGSSPFATGQALYALKQAGVNISSLEFSRGAKFLLDNQNEAGFWAPLHSQSGRPSQFAPTMWAVIGLAGSFRTTTLLVSHGGKTTARSNWMEVFMDTTMLVAAFALLAFLVERLTNGAAILLGYWPWWRDRIEGSPTADPDTRARIERNRRVSLFGLSALLAVPGAVLMNLNLLPALGFGGVAPIAGQLTTGLLIASGADPIRDLLRLREKKPEPAPIQIAGTLVLKQPSSDRDAGAVHVIGKHDA